MRVVIEWSGVAPPHGCCLPSHGCHPPATSDIFPMGDTPLAMGDTPISGCSLTWDVGLEVDLEGWVWPWDGQVWGDTELGEGLRLVAMRSQEWGAVGVAVEGWGCPWDGQM